MATKTPFLSLFHARPKDVRQGSRKRGYDSRWEKLRDRFIAENPICKHCQEGGYVNPASEVDHIRPFNGLYDPLRLSWDNLQSLCHSCHVTKTHREQKGG
jgi:5-methylcytosine-specific restriction enzyme A